MFSTGLLHVRIRHLLYLIVALQLAIDLQMTQAAQLYSRERIHGQQTLELLLSKRPQSSIPNLLPHCTRQSTYRKKDTVVRLRSVCSDKFVRINTDSSPKNKIKSRVMADGNDHEDLRMLNADLNIAEQSVSQELWLRRELSPEECQFLGPLDMKKGDGETLVELMSPYPNLNYAYLCLKRNGKPFLRLKRKDLIRDSFHDKNCVFAEKTMGFNVSDKQRSYIKLRLPKSAPKSRSRYKSRTRRRRRHQRRRRPRSSRRRGRHRARRLAFCKSGKPKRAQTRSVRGGRRRARRERGQRRRYRRRWRRRRTRREKKEGCACRKDIIVKQGGKNQPMNTGGAWLELSYAFVHYWWLGPMYCKDSHWASSETCRHAGNELRRKPWALADYDPRRHFNHTPRYKKLLSLLFKAKRQFVRSRQMTP